MDGELRKIFHSTIRQAMWTAVETGTTAAGVPDSEYCFPGGICGWVEHKRTEGWAVVINPQQVAWISRRIRYGGRCFIAVRRKRVELWLVAGQDAQILSEGGLRAIRPIGSWSGGPSRWDWRAIESALRS